MRYKEPFAVIVLTKLIYEIIGKLTVSITESYSSVALQSIEKSCSVKRDADGFFIKLYASVGL